MTKEELKQEAEKKFKEWKSEQYKDQSDEERFEFVEHLHTFPKYFQNTFKDGYLASAEPREKRIAELEEKISVLLSCKNCSENKGGYICEKEYENKCLAQKIQYIKELQEENAELQDKLNNLVSVAEVRLANWQKLEKENAELKNKLEHRNCLDCSNHSSKLRMRTLELEKECTKAKELLRYYFDCFKNDNKYTLSDFEVVEDTEQFLSEVE